MFNERVEGVVELNKVCDFYITFREFGSKVPIIKKHRFKTKSLCVKRGKDLYLSNLTNIRIEVQKNLNLPKGTTILNSSTYIGEVEDPKIKLEIILKDKSYIRKLKIQNILDND